jgi:hypothetical protein
MFVKIIGKNHGSYPYRVGLNTLKYTGETFNPTPKCGEGGLYYCEIQYVFEWLGYGDTVCIVRPADAATVVQVDRKWKTDRLVIDEMKKLWEVSTIQWLVENCADIHADNDSALLNASMNRYLEVVQYLCEHGADIHAYGEYAMRCAAMNGHLGVVQYLCEHGADIHAYGECAVRRATENGHLEVVKYLCEHGANIHVKENTSRGTLLSVSVQPIEETY